MKIILYTEDIPVKDGFVSTGLSRVNSYFIRHLDSALDFSFFFNRSVSGHFRRYREVEAAILNKSNMGTHDFMFKLFSFLFLVAIRVLKIKVDLYFKLILNKSIHSNHLLARGNGAIVFAPIGIDYSAIRRAKLLSDFLSVPLVLYLVDDPIANLKAINRCSTEVKVSSEEFGNLIRSASKIITISEGLRDHIEDTYKVNCVTMGLPYIEKNLKIVETGSDSLTGDYVVFVGNTSHFYQEGIETLLSVLVEEFNGEIELVFTIPSDYVSHLKQKYPSVVRVHNCKNESELGGLVHQAIFAFLPYSFSDKYRDMVSTSFPSKFLDYCSWAKRILIFAPDYSVSAMLAVNNNLPYSILNNDAGIMLSVIKEIKLENADYSSLYSSYLRDNHINYDFNKTISHGLEEWRS